MTDTVKNNIFDTIYKATLLTALLLSMGVCSGVSLLSCAITAIFAAVVYVIKPGDSLLPAVCTWLIAFASFNYTGTAGTAVAMMLAGVLAAAAGRLTFIKEALKSEAFLAAVMLGAALSVTVLATTDYFGIGAQGKNVIEMLKNYRSLGFHPNWRGILYGTIVMVVMITYPRKFKRASKVVSAMFAGIVFTYLLNFALVPEGAVKTFAMIEKTRPQLSSLHSAGGFAALNIKTLPWILLFGVSLAAVFLMANAQNDGNGKSFLTAGTAQVLMPALYGYTFPGRAAREAKEMLWGLGSAALIAAFMFPTRFFAHLPVASCAVVLIVGAWQQVRWGFLKKAFSGVPQAALFIITLALTLLTNISFGIIAGLILSCVLGKLRPSAEKTDTAKEAE